jgi:hypothetical protein
MSADGVWRVLGDGRNAIDSAENSVDGFTSNALLYL